VARRLIQAYNDRNIEAISDVLDEAVELSRPGVQIGPGREAALAVYRQDWEEFPDLRLDVKSVVAEGAVIAVEFALTGTNTGPLHLPDGTTAPATGRYVFLPGVSIVELKNGLISAVRNYWDNMTTFDQLGLLPAPTG
jgi:predicted ester cyclase